MPGQDVCPPMGPQWCGAVTPYPPAHAASIQDQWDRSAAFVERWRAIVAGVAGIGGIRIVARRCGLVSWPRVGAGRIAGLSVAITRVLRRHVAATERREQHRPAKDHGASSLSPIHYTIEKLDAGARKIKRSEYPGCDVFDRLPGRHSAAFWLSAYPQDCLFHVPQPVLAEIDRVADEERGRPERTARDRHIGVRDQFRLHRRVL